MKKQLLILVLCALSYGQEFDGSMRLPESDADFNVQRSVAFIDADGHQQLTKVKNGHTAYLTLLDGNGILTAIPPIKSCNPPLRVIITVQGVKAHHEWRVALDYNSCADGLAHWKVGDKISVLAQAKRFDDNSVPTVLDSEGSGFTVNRSRDWTGNCGVGDTESIKECKSRK
jgi:hypothetical protein